MQKQQALIIGASSGIGEALARKLIREDWRVVLTARRLERLQSIAAEIGPHAETRRMDLSDTNATRHELESLWRELGRVDLVILSAGTGHLNPKLLWEPEQDTIEVNVAGFTAAAQTVMRLFLEQGHGHLAGISSIARFRGSGEAPAYAASKAFVSVYLDGLRDLAARRKTPIFITELCPGFVDTAMMQTDRPFWVATPEKAAAEMLQAIRQRKKCAYITRRWALVAALLRWLPRP